MWLDGLDVRLVTHFGAMIQENFKAQQQPVEKPESYSSKVFSHARPSWIKNSFQAPPYRYPWEDTNATLAGDSKKAPAIPTTVFVGVYQSGRRRPHVADLFLLDSVAAARRKDQVSHRHTSTTAFFIRSAVAA